MAKKLASDRTLFVTTVALLSFGLAMLYSASAVVAHEAHQSAHFFFVKQAIWAAVGLTAAALLMRMDYRRLGRPAIVYGLLVLSVVLLIAVLFAPPFKNAHRWFRLGVISFQPSELAKLALVLALAHQLTRRADRLEELVAGLVPSLLVTGLLACLVLIEPDFGTAFCLAVVGAALLFVAGAPLRFLVGLAAAAAPVVYLLIIRVDYRRDRLLAFLDPWEDPLGKGFQAIQSLIAVGTGGLAGLGFMQSRQKLFYLPEPHTDFIFAVIGEEFGLLGALGLLVGFTVILWRGLVIARAAPDRFGALLAAGLTIMIFVQALINISVVLALLPTTGIPLPFISAGGTSLSFSLAAVGVLLAISQHAR
jgi:cell division protein FtsW